MGMPDQVDFGAGRLDEIDSGMLDGSRVSRAGTARWGNTVG